MLVRETHRDDFASNVPTRRFGFGRRREDGAGSRDTLGKLMLAIVVVAIVGLEMLLGFAIYAEIAGTAPASIPFARSAPPIALGILVALAVLAILRKGTP
jgi:hypothetical protein